MSRLLFPVRVVLIVFVISSFFAALASAYTIVLKTGQQIDAQGPYEVRGDRAFFTRTNGSQTSIPLSEVDVEKTKSFNTNNLGNSTRVLGDDGARPLTTSDVNRNNQTPGAAIGSRRLSTGRSNSGPQIRKTRAGYPDLQVLRRERLPDAGLAEAIVKALENRGIRRPEVFQGTSADRAVIHLQAPGAKEVFEALEAVAHGFLEVKPAHRQLAAFEVLMVDRSNERSGQFLIGPADAKALAEGKVSPSDFFVQKVQF